MSNIPAACRPKYNKSLADIDSDVVLFRTRRDAVFHAWYVMERHDVNLFKEGPYYACRIGSKLFATGWRNLNNFTVKQFEDCINSEYFPNA